MTAFVILIVLWNAAAIGLGLAGAFRREARQKLGRLANAQAATAVALSVVALILAALARFVGPALGSAETSVVVAAAGLFFAVVFWAAGGLVPFTVAVFLLARPRGESDDDV